MSAPKISVSEDGLFEPISSKVSGALSDEYVEQIKACARKAAADGTNMVSSGYASMRDAQMGKHVSLIGVEPFRRCPPCSTIQTLFCDQEKISLTC